MKATANPQLLVALKVPRGCISATASVILDFRLAGIDVTKGTRDERVGVKMLQMRFRPSGLQSR